MTQDSKFVKIVNIASTIFHILFGIIIFIIAFQHYEVTQLILGMLILIGCIPHFLLYCVDRSKKGYLLLGTIGVAVALIAIIFKQFELTHIFIMWGVLDVCRGATEIFDSLPKVKTRKLEIIELLVSTGDIIIGILLCIHLEEGLKLHLIYFGVSFILIGLKYIIEMLVESRVKND